MWTWIVLNPQLVQEVWKKLIESCKQCGTPALGLFQKTFHLDGWGKSLKINRDFLKGNNQLLGGPECRTGASPVLWVRVEIVDLAHENYPDWARTRLKCNRSVAWFHSRNDQMNTIFRPEIQTWRMNPFPAIFHGPSLCLCRSRGLTSSIHGCDELFWTHSRRYTTVLYNGILIRSCPEMGRKS